MLVEGVAACAGYTDYIAALVADSVYNSLLILIGSGLCLAALGNLKSIAENHGSVIGCCSKHVKSVSAVFSCILCLKGLYCVCAAGSIGGAEQAAFKVFCGSITGNAGPAVSAQEGGCNAKVTGLCNYKPCILIVDRCKDDIGIFGLYVSELAAEVNVSAGVAFFVDNFNTSSVQVATNASLTPIE